MSQQSRKVTTPHKNKQPFFRRRLTILRLIRQREKTKDIQDEAKADKELAKSKEAYIGQRKREKRKG